MSESERKIVSKLYDMILIKDSNIPKGNAWEMAKKLYIIGLKSMAIATGSMTKEEIDNLPV